MHPTDPDLPRQSLDLAFRTLWKHRPDALACVLPSEPITYRMTIVFRYDIIQA